MEHVKALIIKFIMCTAVLWVVLGLFFGVTFSAILTIAVILTVVSYLLGDLFILPRFENWGATLADFGLAFLGVWFLGYYLNIPLFTAALFSGVIIAIGEYFFHKYVAKHVLDHNLIVTEEEKDIIHDKLQTEFSSELYGNRKKGKKNKR